MNNNEQRGPSQRARRTKNAHIPSWDAQRDVDWNPPARKRFLGGQPVKEIDSLLSDDTSGPELAKLCPEVKFSFDTERMNKAIKAAEAGDHHLSAHEFYHLGMEYDQGMRGEKCLKKAFQCYKAAAREGFVPAIRVLAQRVRGAEDTKAILVSKSIYVPLFHVHESEIDSNKESSSMDWSIPLKIFIDAGVSPSFPMMPDPIETCRKSMHPSYYDLGTW